MISYLTLSLYLLEDFMKSDIDLVSPHSHNTEKLHEEGRYS